MRWNAYRSIDISIAVALLARAPNIPRRSPGVDLALVTPLPGVSFSAVAHDLLGPIRVTLCQIAGISMLVPTPRPTGTRTWFAGEVGTKSGIAVVAGDATLAVQAVGEVATIDAGTGALVTDGGMAIALAGTAVGEGPEARLTLVALPASDASLAAFALS